MLIQHVSLQSELSHVQDIAKQEFKNTHICQNDQYSSDQRRWVKCRWDSSRL